MTITHKDFKYPEQFLKELLWTCIEISVLTVGGSQSIGLVDGVEGIVWCHTSR